MIALRAYIQGQQISEVARKAGITRSTLQRILAGKTLPKIDTLFILIDIFGITDPDEILHVFESYRHFNDTTKPKVITISAAGGIRRAAYRLSNQIVKELNDYKVLYIHDRHYDIADWEFAIPYRGIENGLLFQKSFSGDFYDDKVSIEFIVKHLRHNVFKNIDRLNVGGCFYKEDINYYRHHVGKNSEVQLMLESHVISEREENEYKKIEKGLMFAGDILEEMSKYDIIIICAVDHFNSVIDCFRTYSDYELRLENEGVNYDPTIFSHQEVLKKIYELPIDYTRELSLNINSDDELIWKVEKEFIVEITKWIQSISI